MQASVVPAQVVLSDAAVGLEGSTLIPVDIGSRLLSQRVPTVTLVEQGKKLLQAAAQGNAEEVRDLMSKGTPFTTDWLGTNPLHMAAMYNHVETCEVLLRAGISRDARTKVDRTPLHMAAYEGHVEVVELLLQHGAAVNSRDMLNMTPLHWACQNAHMNVVSSLLSHGARIDVESKFEKTPFDIAIEIGRLDIAEMLEVVTYKNAAPTLTIEMEQTNNCAPDEASNCTSLLEETGEESETAKEEVPVVQLETALPKLNEKVKATVEASESETLKYLKEHGITMLPPDETSIVATAMENGHSVVLTEAGKEILDAIKPVSSKVPTKKPPQLPKVNMKKIIAISAEQFLAMTNAPNTNLVRKLPNVLSANGKAMKRVVMDKNKMVLASTSAPLKRVRVDGSDVEVVSRQLQEAKRQLEEYKMLYKQKEIEINTYKKQLRLLLQLKQPQQQQQQQQQLPQQQ